MNIISVENDTQIKEVERLADIVWREHYSSIITIEQIDYMLKSFQSFETISAQIQDNYNYFLLTDNQANVGYISYKITENIMFLSKIYILAEHRGRGHAKSTVDYLKKVSQVENCTKIRLTVNQNNVGSINAYQKMGFINACTQIADIGNGFFMEDYVMELLV